MGTCYLVLGCTRSGTSVTAGLLHALGVVMGWELTPEHGQAERYDWPDPWEANPRGFWQDAPVENVQDAIWGDDYPLEGTRPEPGPLVEEFRSLVRMRCRRGHAAWGMKTSRTAWLLPEFAAACSDDIRFVVTARDPDASARSLDRWWPYYGLPQCQEWVRRVNVQVAAVLAEPRWRDVPRLTVRFDDLFARPDGVLAELSTFTGLPVSEKARRLIDPSLRRVL